MGVSTGTGPVLRALRKARRLVRGGWCQGAAAKTLGRRACDLGSPAACRFCASGAIHRAATDTARYQVFETLRRAIYGGTAVGPGIPSWNDEPGRRKAHVLQAFSNAIKIAKAEGL